MQDEAIAAPREQQVPSRTTAGMLVLCVVIALGVLVRFLGLDHLPGINGDEAYLAFQNWRLLVGEPVTFKTGSGLPLNPLYSAASLLAHAVGGFGTTVMRFPPLFYGVLAIAAGGLMCRGQVDRRTRVFFMALLACSPVLIAYARFSWDPSITPFVSVLCLWAAIRCAPVWIVLSLLLAIWVHVTNVFLVPVTIAPWLYRRLRHVRKTILLGALVVALVVVLVLPLLAEMLHLPPPLGALAFGPAAKAEYLERLRSPSQFLQFMLRWSDLFSGVTIYTFITGGVSDFGVWIHRAAFWIVVPPLVLMGVRRSRHVADIFSMAIAFGLTLVIAFFLGGLRIVTPHFERYGFFLVVPTLWLFAQWASQWSIESARKRIGMELAVAGACLAQLVSISTFYLGGLMDPDARAPLPFRTGPVEPKVSAFAAIDGVRDTKRETLVFADDWWSYWPIRYQVGSRKHFHVTIPGLAWDYRFPKDFVVSESIARDAEIFGVAFTGSKLDRWLGAQGGPPPLSIQGYPRTPILHVYRVERR